MSIFLACLSFVTFKIRGQDTVTAENGVTAAQYEDQPPYPSWEDLCAMHNNAPAFTIEQARSQPPPPRFAAHTHRLLWHLRDEFPACTSVAYVEGIEEGAEPFYKAAGDGGTWHEISDLPMTTPKVSAIDASSYDLEQLESDWAWIGDPGDAQCRANPDTAITGRRASKHHNFSLGRLAALFAAPR